MNDLISRQAARMCLTGDITDMSIEQYIEMVDKRLEQLPPSPTPSRPHGKWLPEYGNVKAKAHYCSVCEFYYTTDPDEMHYCPHCGADMTEGR